MILKCCCHRTHPEQQEPERVGRLLRTELHRDGAEYSGTGGHEEVRGAESGQRGLPGEHAGHGHAGAPGQTDAAPGRDGG